MRRERRWALAIVLCAVAAISVTGTILAAYNPWRLVHLEPFGAPGPVTAALFAAPLLIGTAVWLVVRDWMARGIVAGAALLLAAALCVGGMQFSAVYGLSADAPPLSTTVAAVAPGGRFEIVDERYSGFGSSHDVLRLRSREGWRSRASGRALACFSRPEESDPAPEDSLRSVRFAGDGTVEIVTGDGRAWTTAFDPGTLVAAATLQRGCSG